MLIFYQRKWWLFLLRGLAAVLFGLLAIIWPELTVMTLVILFGAFVLVDGLFALLAGFVTVEGNPRWWALNIAGLLAVVIGVVTFIWPEITETVLLYFIAAWAVVTGLFRFIAALQLRQTIAGEWLMLLNSILSVIFGILLFVFPQEGAVGLVIVIGVFAMILGILNIIFGLQLRRVRV